MKFRNKYSAFQISEAAHTMAFEDYDVLSESFSMQIEQKYQIEAIILNDDAAFVHIKTLDYQDPHIHEEGHVTSNDVIEHLYFQFDEGRIYCAFMKSLINRNLRAAF